MPNQSLNHVLFDIDSIIDIEISIILYIDHMKWDSLDLKWLNVEKFYKWKNTNQLAFNRSNGTKSPFTSIVNDGYDPYDIMNTIWDRDHDVIINGNMVFITDMIDLVKAYNKVGDNTIVSCVVVEDEIIKKFLLENGLLPHNIIISKREDIDLKKYGRIVVGNYKRLFNYKFTEPKSILLLNYRENYTDDDINVLRPELIINFGDINEIAITKAYKIF